MFIAGHIRQGPIMTKEQQQIKDDIKKIKDCMCLLMDRVYYPRYITDLQIGVFPDTTGFKDWLKTQGLPWFWLEWKQ